MGRGLAWLRRHVGRTGDASVCAGGKGGVGGVAGGLAPGGERSGMASSGGEIGRSLGRRLEAMPAGGGLTV